MKIGFIKDKVPILYFFLFSLVLGISSPILIGKFENPLSALVFFIVALVLFVSIKYPEVAFALFVNAGIFKADPRIFLPEPLDLTVLFGIVSITGIILKIASKHIKIFYPPKRIILPYLIIAVLCIISLSYTLAPIYGSYKLIKFLTITTFAMFGPLFLFQNEDSLKRFFITYVLIVIATLFDVVYGGEMNMYKYNFTQAFGSSGYLGLGKFSGEVLLILSFYFFFKTKTLPLKIIIVGLLISSVFLTLVSGARGSTIALSIVFMAIFIYILGNLVKNNLSLNLKMAIRGEKREIKIFVGFVILFFLCVFTIVLFHDHFSNLFSRTDLLLSNVEESLPVRLYQYYLAVEVLTSFPSAITGLGIGGFSVFAHGYDKKRGAFVHNVFLDFGVDIGIFGLIFFTFLIYWAFVTGFSNIKNAANDNQYFASITLLSLFLFMVIYASIHGNINDSRSLLTWLGSIYAYKRLIYQRKIQIPLDEIKSKYFKKGKSKNG